MSRTWRCLFLVVMAAYPLVTTLSLRLQDKVGAVRHNKLPQLLFHKRKHANKKYVFYLHYQVKSKLLLSASIADNSDIFSRRKAVVEGIPGICSRRVISGGMTGVNMRRDYEFNLKIRVWAV